MYRLIQKIQATSNSANISTFYRAVIYGYNSSIIMIIPGGTCDLNLKLMKVSSKIQSNYPDIVGVDLNVSTQPNSKGNPVGFVITFKLTTSSQNKYSIDVSFNRSMDQVTAESIFRKFRILMNRK